MQSKKFAILLCAPDNDYVKYLYGGYYEVFTQILKEEGETWDSFNVSCGNFPAEEEIVHYDGFVITGSRSNAYGDDEWICKLVALLKKLDAMKKKVLGVCFGHQVLGRAIGGRVGRAQKGWDIGLTEIHLHPSPLFQGLEIPASLPIIKCHQDEVYELPPKAEILGRSNNTSIEMFKFGDHIMGIQGHPEYTVDILLYLVHRLCIDQLIEDSAAKLIKSKLKDNVPNKEMWKKLCTNFLKG